MSDYDETSGPGIGATLKDARRRLGMDIKEAEERTKIRTKYLRALEAEDWEVLPAPAYVRGFLRTYGQILGLDGEVLADRYRRGYEEPAAAGPAATEPVLSNRRAAGGRPISRRGPIVVVGGVIVALLVILAIVGLVSGGDENAPNTDMKGVRSKPDNGKSKDEKSSKDSGKSGNSGLEPVDLKIEPLSTVRVCLVGDSNSPLIDSQVLAVGATERFSGEKSYRLDLAGGGTVKLRVGGDKQKLEASGDASFEADSKGISEISYAGPNCP
jgi:cytoskeletal protein RodZ